MGASSEIYFSGKVSRAMPLISAKLGIEYALWFIAFINELIHPTIIFS